MTLKNLLSRWKRYLSLNADEIGDQTNRCGCLRLVVKVDRTVEIMKLAVMASFEIDEWAPSERYPIH
jgi:hypothetical protein